VRTVSEFLAAQPLFLLFLLFGLGSALGGLRIRDVQVGPAAVLFGAIAVSALAAAAGTALKVPDVVGMLGLVLFTDTVGVVSGPTFFAALRGGWGPVLSITGTLGAVAAVAGLLGHRSSHTLVAERSDLDFRRITLSNRALAGRPLGELDLGERFGATVSRVRRGDLDMIADDDLVLQSGDRLRVIVPAARMKEVTGYLGDSERGLSDINPVGFALGLMLGVLLGTVIVKIVLAQVLAGQ
jgi:uncharacterized transporter YbjL